jgi:uncharacterized repeat protein (TIGR01451 family)
MDSRLWLAFGAGLALSYPTPLFAQPPAPPGVAVTQQIAEITEPTAPLSVDVTVSNTGPGPAEGVIVVDLLPTGYDLLEANPAPETAQGALTWRLGRLASGETRTLRLRLKPRGPEVSLPPQNVVEASFEGRTRSVCVAQVRAPELSLKVVAPPTSYVGQPVVWRMEIANKGAMPARDVIVQTLLSEGLSHPLGVDLESNLGTLSPGETRTATLEATATRSGDLQARVTVLARGARPATQTAPLHADPNPLTLTVNGPRVLMSQLTGLYELTVRNDGPAIREVVLTATTPSGLEFVHASNGGVHDAHSRLVRWDLGELAAGEQRTLAWNGEARACGDLESLVRLTVGGRVVREQAWVTRVVSGEPTRSAASAPRSGGP